jgi:hypothetical protein
VGAREESVAGSLEKAVRSARRRAGAASTLPRRATRRITGSVAW